MKFLIVMLLCASASSVYGRLPPRMRGSLPTWENRTLPFSKYYGAKSVGYFLRYQIDSWEQLQYRRDAISKAIAGLEEQLIRVSDPSASAYLADQGTVSDVRPLLYEIMEQTVALHSALPRATQTGKPLLSPGDMPTVSAPGSLGAGGGPRSITFAALENSFVNYETWELYTSYGDKIRSELEKVLQKAPEPVLADAHRKEFMRMFDDEFDQSGTREITSVSGGLHGGGGETLLHNPRP